jgi:hypothetical protein
VASRCARQINGADQGIDKGQLGLLDEGGTTVTKSGKESIR